MRMASVNIQKFTMTEAAHMSVHFDNKLRLVSEHSNKDINKELSHLNYWIGCASYSDVMNKLKNRLTEVDSVQPPGKVRADRKTVCSWEFPCPWEIVERGEADKFFQKAYEVIQQQAGAENLAGMTVHRDEVHEYMDQGTMKKSMIHADAFVTPYNPEKGVNCKSVCTRKFFKEVNAAMDDMCRREFGIAYQTGEFARQKSVEQLKAESYRALQNAEVEKAKQVQEASERVISLNKDLKDKMSTLDELEAKINSQERTALEEINKVIEPLKKQAGQKIKGSKVVISDSAAYKSIEEMEQTIREYVLHLKELQEGLADREDSLDARSREFNECVIDYNEKVKNFDSILDEKSRKKAHEYYKDWIELTISDLKKGGNRESVELFAKIARKTAGDDDWYDKL
jgi:hypothetical protein